MVRATGSSSPSRVLSSRSPAVAIKLAGTNASVDEQGVSNIAAHALLLRGVLLTIGDYLTVLTIAAALPLLCWRILSFGALASEARRKPVSEQHLHVLACLAESIAVGLADCVLLIPFLLIVLTGWRLWPLLLRLWDGSPRDEDEDVSEMKLSERLMLRLRPHGAILSELGYLLLELPFATGFLLIAVTGWRAWWLVKAVVLAGRDNTARRQEMRMQFIFWLLDPVAVLASLLVLPSWRGPHLCRQLCPSDLPSAVPLPLPSASRSSQGRTMPPLHVDFGERFGQSMHNQAFRQLVELLFDVPFVVFAGVLAITPWRLLLFIQDACKREQDAPKRRGAAARQLILCLLDLLCIPAFAVVVGTIYRLPAVLRASRLTFDDGVVDSNAQPTRASFSFAGREHGGLHVGIDSAEGNPSSLLSRHTRCRACVELDAATLSKSAKWHFSLLSEAIGVVLDAPFILMAVLPLSAPWRTREFITDVRAASVRERRKLCVSHAGNTIVDLPFVAIALVTHVIGFYRTPELIAELTSASRFAEIRISMYTGF